MKAAVLTAPGTPPEIRELPEPVAGQGQLRVRVTAAAIAPIDRLIASATSYLGAPPFPYTPGLHGTGVTDDGRHVWFVTGAGLGGQTGGAAAEYAVVSEALTLPLTGRHDLEAAALGGSAVAAVGALTRGGLAAGSTVVVLGAAGVVGSTAVQYARARGARVVAVARGADDCARSRALGADTAVDAASGDLETITAELHRACPDGADLVLDPVWGVPASAALAVLRPGGRLVNLGDSAGPDLALTSALVRSRSLSIIGWTNAALGWAEQCALLTEALELVDAGLLTVAVTAVPLDGAAAAWDAPTKGRLVLVP